MTNSTRDQIAKTKAKYNLDFNYTCDAIALKQ
jgi:hypothetical protein